MTDIEFLAFVGAPLMLMAAGIGVYFLTGWLDRRDVQKTSYRHPRTVRPAPPRPRRGAARSPR
jgi:hypothetical protein